MKRFIIFISSILCTLSLFSQYNGGSKDGFDIATATYDPGLQIYLGGDKDGFAVAVLGEPGTEVPLPVELLYFKAKSLKGEVQLVWATASEINNDHFVIERSKDAVEWLPLDSVDGAGNSSVEQHYVDVDDDPLTGVSYYRLKQVDFDGNFSHSNVVTVTFEKTEEISLFPNPTKGHINVAIRSDEGESIYISVYDAQGKQMMNEEIMLTEGINLINRRIRGAKGMYFIKIMTSSGKYYDYDVVLIDKEYF